MGAKVYAGDRPVINFSDDGKVGPTGPVQEQDNRKTAGKPDNRPDRQKKGYANLSTNHIISGARKIAGIAEDARIFFSPNSEEIPIMPKSIPPVPVISEIIASDKNA